MKRASSDSVWGKPLARVTSNMSNALALFHAKMQDLMSREEGQDLVEYALVVVIISVGAVAVLGTLATQVQTVFTTITGDL
jgi:pilus assembly protein Flp/PilA